MNAAVSLTMCVFGRLVWKMLPLYVFAQLLGSFLAAGTIYAVYYGKEIRHWIAFTHTHTSFFKIVLVKDVISAVSCFPYEEAIHNYCGGNLTVTGAKATAGIFATYPAPYLSIPAGFIDQVAINYQTEGLPNHRRLTYSAVTLLSM